MECVWTTNRGAKVNKFITYLHMFLVTSHPVGKSTESKVTELNMRTHIMPHLLH